MPLLFTDDRFRNHETGEHPERPARLVSILKRLRADGWLDRLPRGETRLATDDQLRAVHTAEHLARLKAWTARGGGRVEADTVMSPRSEETARLAAGTATAAVDAVLTGPHKSALALVRPPGHHAVADAVMGFCLFNNAAVAAAHALKTHGLNRVLIVDWDVHHGNGTQDIFYDTDRVHFLSAHRFPFYPGSGTAEETGTGAGLGATWNLPVAYGTPRKAYLAKFASLLNDAAAKCRPELVILSAGFDAHAADPIGSLKLETEDFADLTKLVAECAAQTASGRLVSLLEGGYDLDALADSVACHVETLAMLERRV